MGSSGMGSDLGLRDTLRGASRMARPDRSSKLEAVDGGIRESQPASSRTKEEQTHGDRADRTLAGQLLAIRESQPASQLAEITGTRMVCIAGHQANLCIPSGGFACVHDSRNSAPSDSSRQRGLSVSHGGHG